MSKLVASLGRTVKHSHTRQLMSYRRVRAPWASRSENVPGLVLGRGLDRLHL